MSQNDKISVESFPNCSFIDIGKDISFYIREDASTELSISDFPDSVTIVLCFNALEKVYKEAKRIKDNE